MNKTGWHNPKKRAETIRKSFLISASISEDPPKTFRPPSLNHFTGEKKSISELARICGLVFKEGKVG